MGERQPPKPIERLVRLSLLGEGEGEGGREGGGEVRKLMGEGGGMGVRVRLVLLAGSLSLSSSKSGRCMRAANGWVARHKTTLSCSGSEYRALNRPARIGGSLRAHSGLIEGSFRAH